MSCFICQAFGKNSPSNPQLAQECLATPLSHLPSINSRSPALLLFFLTFFSPLPPLFYLFPPQRLPFCPSARLFRRASQALGRRVCECQTSQNARCTHKELLWRWGQICLNWICSLSPLLVFIIPSLYRGPLFSPVLLFPLCPTVNLIFPPTSKPIRCLLCKTLMTDLLE